MCISMARAHREWAKKVGHSEDSLFVNLYSLAIHFTESGGMGGSQTRD